MFEVGDIVRRITPNKKIKDRIYLVIGLPVVPSYNSEGEFRRMNMMTLEGQTFELPVVKFEKVDV